MKFDKRSQLKTLLITTCAAMMAAPAMAQTQKGLDIDGDAANDCYGFVVSMPDTNTVAIGAPFNYSEGNGAGYVRIYSWNSSAWVQKGADIDGEAAGDNSGYSISMPDANTIAIGALNNNNDNGLMAGHVRIYSWRDSVWVQKGADINGDRKFDNSGYSVSMPDANTVAIGTHRDDSRYPDAGQVRIFTWNGSAWVKKGAAIVGVVKGDYFGQSVSMPDSNTVAIGARTNDTSDRRAGHVRIYSWSGSAWVQKGADINGETAIDFSGWSVSMPDAKTVAIGAPSNGGRGKDAGHVRIYSWNSSAWVQKGADIDGESAGDQSGYSVSMPNANTVAIGARWNAGGGQYPGHVRIYTWSSSAWVQKGADIEGEAAKDFFGQSVSMPDANTVAIGAHWNDGRGSNAGHARVYTICGTTTANIMKTSCFHYVSPSGRYQWRQSGTYADTIANTRGCDSVITVNLIIHTADVSVTRTSTNGRPVLNANATNARYQWLDCDRNMYTIDGATNRSFEGTPSGSYAVEVETQAGCKDTSICYSMSATGREPSEFGSNLRIYPNPFRSEVTIDLGRPIQDLKVMVRNKLGQTIMTTTFSNEQLLHLNIPGTVGIYTIELLTPQKTALVRVVKW